MERIYFYFESNQKHFLYLLVVLLIAALVTGIVNYTHTDNLSTGVSIDRLIIGEYPPINILMSILLVFLSFLTNYYAFKMDNTLLNKIFVWGISVLMLVVALLYYLSNGIGPVISWSASVVILALYIKKTFQWLQMAANDY